MARHAECIFTGITKIVSWNFTLGHGAFPSAGTITTVPHASQLPAQADFHVVENGNRKLALRDCAVERATLSTSGANIWTIYFVDRRWRWKFGSIDGVYNIPIKDDPTDVEREKTPRELVQLLLGAIGERGVDVSSIPNDQRPFVQWRATNPAQALGQLLDELGCRLVLHPQNNRVYIVRAGQGAALPRLHLEKSVQLDYSRGALPDLVRSVCAPVRYQGLYDLEAVAEEEDGTFVPLDDCSYLQGVNIGHLNLPEFSAVKGSFDRDGREIANAELAKRSVFRMYRITQAAGRKDFSPPGWDQGDSISDLERILPIHQDLNTTVEDGDGREKPRAAYIVGEFAADNYGTDNVRMGTVLQLPVRIDQDNGIVVLPEYVYKWRDEQHKEAARLQLVCAVEVSDRNTGVKLYYGFTFRVGEGREAKPYLVHLPDLVPRFTGVYRDGEVTRVEDNLSQIDQQAERRGREAAAQELQLEAGGAVSYSGIHPIVPDGAIQQVTWSGPLASTTASRNMEIMLPQLTHRQRRRTQDQRRQAFVEERERRREAFEARRKGVRS